jgi:glycosyltransferase involved in cell wall biosynthesis
LVDQIDQPWTIIGDLEGLPGGDLPPHVRVLCEIKRDDYLQHLREARLVVLPLLPSERATGQVVLLEAMSLGKPVIATRTTGTADLIRHGINGWLIEPGQVDAWIETIRHVLNHPIEAEQAGRRAVQVIRDHHLPRRHTELRLHAIRELYRARNTDASSVTSSRP